MLALVVLGIGVWPLEHIGSEFIPAQIITIEYTGEGGGKLSSSYLATVEQSSLLVNLL